MPLLDTLSALAALTFGHARAILREAWEDLAALAASALFVAGAAAWAYGLAAWSAAR